MARDPFAGDGPATRLPLLAGAAGLAVFAVWDAVLAATGPGLDNLGWWAGVALGATAAALWIRWARHPLPVTDWRWQPWQWVTALPLVALPFITRPGDGPPTALGYECTAYLSCLMVLCMRWRQRDTPPKNPPPPPATTHRPANRG